MTSDHPIQCPGPDLDLAGLQADVIERILAGTPLAQTAEAVCHLVEAGLPGTRVSILTADPASGTTTRCCCPSLPPDWPELFDDQRGRFRRDQLDRLRPATACAWREDLGADPDWEPIRDRLIELGIAAYYLSPVLTPDGRLRGAIHVYWPDRHQPSAGDRRVVHLAAVLIGLALDRDQSNTLLEAAASRDPVTDLPNRAVFLDRVRQSLARARRHGTGVAVLFIDLDRFRAVNGSLGHAAGDRLLAAAAGRLTAALRPEDTVARFAADQFTGLCEDVTDDAAWSLGERVAAAMRAPFVVAHRQFFLTASVGVTTGGAGSRAQDLLRDADLAMKRAKLRQPGGVGVFDATLHDQQLRHLDDEAALRHDLDVGSVPMVFQPVLDLGTLRPVGVDALVRWRRPRGGVLGLRALGDLAEAAGLLPRLSAAVIGRAVDALTALGRSAPLDRRFCLSIKVGDAEVADPGAAARLRDAVEQAGMGPDHLALDLTSATVADEERIPIATLRELQGAGASLWLDDFGTTPVPLSRLGGLPLAGVKVDLDGLAEGEGAVDLLALLTGLAGSFGLRTMARGVDDATRLGRVLAAGIGAGQGRHLGSPVELDALADELQRRRTVPT